MWLNFKLPSIIIFIVAGYAICISLSAFIRLVIYRSELRAFLVGNPSKRKHKIEKLFELKRIRTSIKDSTISELERRVAAERMIWKKGESGFCCFNGLFPFFPIKLVIEIAEKAGDASTFDLKFHFYDRFLNPVMINSIRSGFLKKMNNMYIKLTHGLLEEYDSEE